MILDEGHLIKNPNTKRAKSLVRIPFTRRIIITGTPLQNNLTEFWALLEFCCPNLFKDEELFEKNYESYIIRGNEKNASELEKGMGSDATKSQIYEDFLNNETVISACKRAPLAALTILRKMCNHPCLLSKGAAAFQKDVLGGMASTVGKEDRQVTQQLAKYMANVAADKLASVDQDLAFSKIPFLQSLLDSLIPQGQKVLVFSQTLEMLDTIQRVVRAYGSLRIDGNTKDRAAIVKHSQKDDGPQILLLTSQVGGVGLTLTQASCVIIIDPAWNPSTDNQSVDRAYRIGQKKEVIVYRLITCGTIEEKIYRQQVFKGGLFKTATEDKEQTRYFSQKLHIHRGTTQYPVVAWRRLVLLVLVSTVYCSRR